MGGRTAAFSPEEPSGVETTLSGGTGLTVSNEEKQNAVEQFLGE